MTIAGDTVVCLSSPTVTEELLNSIDSVATTHDKHLINVTVGDSEIDIPWDDTAAVIAVGGDGTFLEGVRVAAPNRTPLLAINAGTLGFLARISPNHHEQAITDLLTGNADVIDREMLAVTGPVTGTGINDVMVEALPPENPTDRKVATLHAYIDDEYVGEFTGDGVAIATPTGSTAVAFSAGGPVHYPNANSSLQLTPLNTHNAGVRPVIVDSDTTITIIPETDVRISIDGGRTYDTIGDGDELRVTGAEDTAKIVRTEYDETFFDALSGKLGWGIRDVDEPGPR